MTISWQCKQHGKLAGNSLVLQQQASYTCVHICIMVVFLKKYFKRLLARSMMAHLMMQNNFYQIFELEMGVPGVTSNFKLS
jgi:hypothetical protein